MTKEKIQKAEQVLIDNGIAVDEASTVLQALGYVLLDKELYEKGTDTMNKVHYIILRDCVEYKFDASQFTPEEAEKMAYSLWDERKPQISVYSDQPEDDPENPKITR